MVCTCDVFDRKNPSLSASRLATRAHSRISRPSRNRLIPIRTSNAPKPEVANDLDPLQRCQCRSACSGPECRARTCARSDPRPSLLVNIVTSTSGFLARLLCGFVQKASTWEVTGRIKIPPRDRSVLSAASPAQRTRPRCVPTPIFCGVAETKMVCGRIAFHSSKRKDRLSMQDRADESRTKPESTLRRKSPRYMPPICGTETWLSSSDNKRVVGQVFKQCREVAGHRGASG